MEPRATLVLEDGTRVSGVSFGADTASPGEVVFNTGMTGYPESLTDPSYRGQILVLTYPLIGNYGVPKPMVDAENLLTNFESERIQVAGLIVGSYGEEHSHWSANLSLGAWLREHGVPAITGVDTRALTKKLRERGVMLGKLIPDSRDREGQSNEKETEHLGLEDPNSRNLVEEVSTTEPVQYGKGKRRIVLVDCGVKRSIISHLLALDTTVIRIPWDQDPLQHNPDGIVISNGPGDPKQCRTTITHVRKAIEAKIPMFGICLGHQLMAIAAGAETYKMKYGHRAQNQPCIERKTGRCYITSQNHGFAVQPKCLSEGWEEWWVNANDRTNEGLRHRSGRFFSVQFHPEGNPGPRDSAFLFQEFMKQVERGAGA